VTSDQVSASGRIAAPAHEVFLLVADPACHVEIDGSGMLQAAPDTTQLSAVGQTFDMQMDRRPLGDIPNMAEYQVRCTVTQLIPERLIEWSATPAGQPPSGVVWGWRVVPIGETRCRVTNYCDWTNVSDELRAAYSVRSGGRPWPVVPVDRLEKSVANLARMATQRRR
jgi:hypothetical protein